MTSALASCRSVAESGSYATEVSDPVTWAAHAGSEPALNPGTLERSRDWHGGVVRIETLAGGWVDGRSAGAVMFVSVTGMWQWGALMPLCVLGQPTLLLFWNPWESHWPKWDSKVLLAYNLPCFL